MIISLCGAVLIRVRLLKVGEILVPDAIDIVGYIRRVTNVIPYRAWERSVLDIPDHPERAGVEGCRLIAEQPRAIAEEFAGREDEAKRWYNHIVDNFPKAASAKKGAGAIARLDSGRHHHSAGATSEKPPKG